MALGVLVPTKGDELREADETGLRSEIINTIRDFASNSPRSLQRTIGPSQVGTPCARELAYNLSDRPRTRDLHDPLASILGTAFHAWLAECVAASNPPPPHPPIWLLENRVDVGNGLRGSSDAFHVPSGTVIDWKMLSETSYRRYKDNGPSETYEKQAQCYGFGFARQGFHVTRVAIAFFCKTKKLSDLHIWSAPYDPQVALGALGRMRTVQRLLASGIDPSAVPKTPGGNCHFCFAGETKYWTESGLRRMDETVDTKQRVLSMANGSVRWVDAEIKSFGEQPLMRVVATRHSHRRTFYATPDHRWLTRSAIEERKVVLTRDLKSGCELACLTPPKVTPSPIWAARGIVFGDGHREPESWYGTHVALWGEKEKQLLPYFGLSRVLPVTNSNDTEGIRVVDLPGYWKDAPPMGESASYLLAWLTGFFAAKGSVSTAGQVILSSPNREQLELAQRVSIQLGILTSNVTTSLCGRYKLEFCRSSLKSEFFLIQDHRDRFDASMAPELEPFGWVVESVETTDRVEEVFCAVVPDHENFALDGFINVMNCSFRSADGGKDGYCTGKDAA